jgi:hypothetical protein
MKQDTNINSEERFDHIEEWEPQTKQINIL